PPCSRRLANAAGSTSKRDGERHYARANGMLRHKFSNALEHSTLQPSLKHRLAAKEKTRIAAALHDRGVRQWTALSISWGWWSSSWPFCHSSVCADRKRAWQRKDLR